MNNSQKQRYRCEENEDRTVEVSKDVLNQLYNVNYFSQKKGKILFMLMEGKKFGVIDRKRKYDRYNNTFLIGIILWQRWTISPLSTSQVLLHYSSFSDFRCTQWWPIAGSILSLDTVCLNAAVLLQAISPTNLSSRFPFRLHIHDIIQCMKEGTSRYALREFRVRTLPGWYDS